MRNVIVGSLNPTKLEATKLAFAEVWPDERFQFEQIDIASGVAEQPMNEEETIQGATERARRALEKSGGDFGVGIEGGQYEINGETYLSDWAAVVSKDGTVHLGGSCRYHIPKHIVEHISSDRDLSAVLEEEFNLKAVGKLYGYAGLMTGNFITRTTSNRDAVIIALAPFVRDHYRLDFSH